jgi:hypothetical protein
VTTDDPIFAAFLRRQEADAAALTAASDLVEVRPVDGSPASRYLVTLRCRGLVRPVDGEPRIAEGAAVGIWFPPDYLRRADPFEVLTWLGPPHVFHPNIGQRTPAICIGHVAPGAGLAELVGRIFDVVTCRKVTVREDDALNPAACGWARENLRRFPLDDRPLRRRRLDFAVRPAPAAEGR